MNPPTEINVQRQSRLSCDPCRAKKVRCTGEHPVCSRCLSTNRVCLYSMQMPMGRPKARTSTHRESTHRTRRSRRREQAQLSRSRDTAPIELASAQHAGDEVSEQGPSLTRQLEQFSSDATVTPYLVDFEDYQRARTTHPEVQETFLPITGQPESDTCACLSILYLLLEQLRTKDQLMVPDDLSLLQGCIETATQVLNCKQCPLRYLSVIQNATVLGVLCMCIAECYARVLETIDAEASRPSNDDNQKQLSISGMNSNALGHETSPKNTSASFVVETTPEEWRNLMRKVVKAEIFGVEGQRGKKCFMSLIEDLEERQRCWHQTPPATDCPPNYRSTCRYTDRMPTCLMILDDAIRLIGLLGL